MDRNEQYDMLINMKWLPKSGEIKLKPISKGEKINIITRDFFVTDNEGRLLVKDPRHTQMFANLLNHAWEIWVIPELKRMKKAKLPPPYPLTNLLILFDNKKGELPTIEFNYNFKLSLNIRKGQIIKKDQHITFDQIRDFGPIMNIPTKDNKPIAFFKLVLYEKQISLCFDFRPNDPKFDKKLWKDEGMWLASATLETFLARYFGHLALIIPELSKKDIPFTIGIKTQKMKMICNFIEKGLEKDKINKKLSRLITREDVETLVDYYLSFDLFRTRTNILTEVKKSFKNGIYGAVILLLMSQVEGIITEYLILNGKGLKTNGKAKNWETRINEFYKTVIEKEKIGPLTLKILENSCHFLKNSNLYKKFTWDSNISQQINRHAAMHGKDTTFNTRDNAIRMILLFDALFWIFHAISESKKE